MFISLVLLQVFIFLIVLKSIFKKDVLFSFLIIWMFAYCIFSIIAYLYYPQRLALVSSGQYYGMKPFYSYYLYILIFFISTGIYYSFINRIKPLIKSELINVKFDLSKIIYVSTLLSYVFITFTFLVNNFTEISYYNQEVLKGNKIWFYSYSVLPIFVLNGFDSILRNEKKIRNIFYLLIILAIGFVTSIKGGQRIMVFTLINAVLVYFITYIQFSKKTILSKESKKKIKSIIRKIPLTLFIFIVFSQLVRFTRGNTEKLVQLNFIELFTNIFNFESMVFQDWVLPSLTLLTSIHYELVDSARVIKTLFWDNFSFIMSYPTLGVTMSRFINPSGTQGFGYYFLTEGYQLIGFAGSFIYSLFIVVIYKIYKTIFIAENDLLYNSYINGVLAIFIINFVRGSSSFFFKGIFYYVIPAVVLYFVKHNRSIKIYRNK